MRYLIAGIIGAFASVAFIGKHISSTIGDLIVAILGAILAVVILYKFTNYKE